MKVIGHGVTTCGFCEGFVYVEILGEVVPPELLRSQSVPMSYPVFCSQECARASRTRLDESVNRAVMA